MYIVQCTLKYIIQCVHRIMYTVKCTVYTTMLCNCTMYFTHILLHQMSKLTDATRSVKRTIKNNFLDDDRQEAIEDFLLYPDKPLPPVISKLERFC